MRLAKIQLARAIWLFDPQEINPRGFSASLLDDKLANRYGFKRDSASRHKFLDGTFVFDGSNFDIGLEVHNDGMVADSRHSTSISDLFIMDVLTWLSQELKGQIPRIRKRIYKSEAILYASRGLSGVSPALDRLAALVASVAGEPQELSAVVFGSSNSAVTFTFERKVNEPLEDNVFYSSASVPTEQHFQLLDAIEKMIEPELRNSDASTISRELRSDLNNSGQDGIRSGPADAAGNARDIAEADRPVEALSDRPTKT